MFSYVLGLDFETANPGRSSACAVAAVKYDLSGKETGHYFTLINPHEEFDIFNTMINGIDETMVADAPDISEAMSRVFQFLDDQTIVVCHNSAFDMSVLRNSLLKDPVEIPDFYFTCTYRIASRVLPGMITYTLPDVAERCGISGLIHHHALSDAAVCAKILLYLSEEHGGIENLHAAANLNPGHFAGGEYDGIHKNVREPSGKEKRLKFDFDIKEDPSSPFYGKRVAFTGKLFSMTRDEAIEVINTIGGIGSDSFTKKTDILITGYQDPRLLFGKEKSSKRIAAEKMRAAGKNIEIIPEEEFIKLL